MPEIRPPKDLLGNELATGDVVTYHPERQMIGKIVAVQNGGLHTNQGQTPALVRVVFDITVGCAPGGQLTPFVKVVSPRNEEIISRILSENPPARV